MTNKHVEIGLSSIIHQGNENNSKIVVYTH